MNRTYTSLYFKKSQSRQYINYSEIISLQPLYAIVFWCINNGDIDYCQWEVLSQIGFVLATFSCDLSVKYAFRNVSFAKQEWELDSQKENAITFAMKLCDGQSAAETTIMLRSSGLKAFYSRVYIMSGQKQLWNRSWFTLLWEESSRKLDVQQSFIANYLQQYCGMIDTSGTVTNSH